MKGGLDKASFFILWTTLKLHEYVSMNNINAVILSSSIAVTLPWMGYKTAGPWGQDHQPSYRGLRRQAQGHTNHNCGVAELFCVSLEQRCALIWMQDITFLLFCPILYAFFVHFMSLCSHFMPVRYHFVSLYFYLIALVEIFIFLSSNYVCLSQFRISSYSHFVSLRHCFFSLWSILVSQSSFCIFSWLT